MVKDFFVGKVIPLVLPWLKVLKRSEAIVLRQIAYWLEKTNHIIDGVRWFYLTAKNLAEQTGYSEGTVKRAIAQLKELQILRTEKKSSGFWNQTNWYTIDLEGLKALISPIGSFRSDRLEQNDLLDWNEMIRSFTETSNQEISTADMPAHPPVSVSVVSQEKIEQEEILGNEFILKTEKNQVNESGAIAIGEDLSSRAERETIFQEISEVIAPAPLNPQSRAVVLAHSLERVTAALAVVKENKKKGQVKNPAGMVVRAIQQGWTPTPTTPESATPPTFGDWFDLAQKAGKAVASTLIDGIFSILTPDDRWVAFSEMVATYSISELRELVAANGQT